MGFVQLTDAAGFHHAIILSPATYARHMFPENIATHEPFWKSEDAAWHLATQLTSRYSTLTVLGFRASFPIPHDVWSDATRINACFFSQASRIVLLVPNDAEQHIETFTRTCLGPLLTKPEEDGGRPDWKERFVAAVIGNVRIPKELAPGVPFIKVIRFREIGWVRDITAMMLLQRAIQEFWVPTHAKSGSQSPYWNWAGGNAHSSCCMSETVETKTALGMCTHVAGQMEPIALESGRSKSVDSRRSSSRRRRQQKQQTTLSRSRSHSQQSNSSGYRSLDAEFEAQQTEELMVDTRVINVVDGSQPIYLVDAPPSKYFSNREDTSKVSKTVESLKKFPSTSDSLESEIELSSTPSVQTQKPLTDLRTGSLATASREETVTPFVDSGIISEKDKPDAPETEEKQPSSELDAKHDDNDSHSESTFHGNSQTEYSEASTIVEKTLKTDDLSQKTITPPVEAEEYTWKIVSTESLEKGGHFSDTESQQTIKHPNHETDQKAVTEENAKPKKTIITTNVSTVKKSIESKSLGVNKQVSSFAPELVSEGVGCAHQPLLLEDSGFGKPVSPPPPPLPPKTKAKLIFSQKFDKKESDQETSVDNPLPYIDSETTFKQKSPTVRSPATRIQGTAAVVSETLCEGNHPYKSHQPSLIVKDSTYKHDQFWTVVNNSGVKLPDYLLYSTQKDNEMELTSTDAYTVCSAPTEELASSKMPTSQTSEVQVAEEQPTPSEMTDRNFRSESLSVVHHIPVVLLPTSTETSKRTRTLHEARTKPSSPLSSQPVAVQTRATPVRVELVETTAHSDRSPTLIKKKQVSYSTETITCERILTERKEVGRKTYPPRTEHKHFPVAQHKTDTMERQSPPIFSRARSATPEHSAFDRTPSVSQTLSSTKDSSWPQSMQTRTTPSGRVLYVRSATPSRLSSHDFTSSKLPRSQSTGQVRLSEPTVLTGSLPESPVLRSKPRVHIYPSPWRPIVNGTVADASTQMAGPLASGYMAGEGVRCYAFTGTHYYKRVPTAPKLVVSKDTCVWTGPDATETCRLEILFATRLKTQLRKRQEQAVQLMPSTTSSLDVVDTQPVKIQKAVPNASSAPSTLLHQAPFVPESSFEKEKQTERHFYWKTKLFYAFSCFVAFITLMVAYTCLFSDSETEQTGWTGFWNWFQTFSSHFGYQ